MLNDYCIYMKQKCKRAKARHECTVVPDSDSGSLCVLPTITVVSSQLTPLNDAIQEKSFYDMLFVNDFCSVDPKKKYQYVQDLKVLQCHPSYTLPVWVLTLETMISSGRFLRVYHWKQQQ